MRENLLPRVHSIKIICSGFTRETGRKKPKQSAQRRKSFCENIQNFCTKPTSVYFAAQIHPTEIYCTHTHTHT
ncbi:hypothetical protein N325_03222, partial [Colius striatus]